jgi:hypothetical protein
MEDKEFYSELGKAVIDARPEPQEPEQERQPDKALFNLKVALAALGLLVLLYAANLAWIYNEDYDRFDPVQAGPLMTETVGVLEVHQAIERYRKDHEGRPPDSLEELTPKYLNELPANAGSISIKETGKGDKTLTASFGEKEGAVLSIDLSNPAGPATVTEKEDIQ